MGGGYLVHNMQKLQQDLVWWGPISPTAMQKVTAVSLYLFEVSLHFSVLFGTSAKIRQVMGMYFFEYLLLIQQVSLYFFVLLQTITAVSLRFLASHLLRKYNVRGF